MRGGAALVRMVQQARRERRPFGGPEQVLDYLGHYIHHVIISDSRLTQIGDSTVSFGWKDYRHHDRH